MDPLDSHDRAAEQARSRMDDASFAARWMRALLLGPETAGAGGRGALQRSLLALGLLTAVALADYLTGYELLFSIFYLVPVGFATLHAGWVAGALASVIAVSASLLGDLASGAHYSSDFVPYWNVLISTAFYVSMVMALTRLRESWDHLEMRVRERTQALEDEVVERKQLESILTEVSDREQRRIGLDLHDSLCQHLAGTALAAEVLKGALERKGLAESGAADHLVGMIEDGIDLSRTLARGLAPVDMEQRGLFTALHELAHSTTRSGGPTCELDVPEPVYFRDPAATTHIFRIAQEAVRNAVRHSQATHIRITLKRTEHEILLSIQDDGVGLSPPRGSAGGLGMHIMRHRASLIGASFEAQRQPRGTVVFVRAPADLSQVDVTS